MLTNEVFKDYPFLTISVQQILYIHTCMSWMGLAKDLFGIRSLWALTWNQVLRRIGVFSETIFCLPNVQHNQYYMFCIRQLTDHYHVLFSMQEVRVSGCGQLTASLWPRHCWGHWGAEVSKGRSDGSSALLTTLLAWEGRSATEYVQIESTERPVSLGGVWHCGSGHQMRWCKKTLA